LLFLFGHDEQTSATGRYNRTKEIPREAAVKIENVNNKQTVAMWRSNNRFIELTKQTGSNRLNFLLVCCLVDNRQKKQGKKVLQKICKSHLSTISIEKLK
jgi:hypothetical protein